MFFFIKGGCCGGGGGKISMENSLTFNVLMLYQYCTNKKLFQEIVLDQQDCSDDNSPSQWIRRSPYFYFRKLLQIFRPKRCSYSWLNDTHSCVLFWKNIFTCIYICLRKWNTLSNPQIEHFCLGSSIETNRLS